MPVDIYNRLNSIEDPSQTCRSGMLEGTVYFVWNSDVRIWQDMAASTKTTEKISRNAEKAITALITQPTIAAAAQASGVSERTLFRWLQDPDFQEAYRQARRETVSHALAGLQQAASEAVECLVKRIRGYQYTEEEFKRLPTGNSIRVKKSRKELPPDVAAARTILEMALKGVELEDIETRLQNLERRLNESKC